MSASSFERELDDLLSEPLEAVVAREERLFGELTAGTQGTLIYGAGNLGRKTLAGLRALGQEPLAILDANPARWGGQLDGCDILSPQAGAERYGRTAATVIAVWSPGPACRHVAIRKTLEELGCRTVVSFVPLFWTAPQVFLPHFRLDVPHKAKRDEGAIRSAFSLLADPSSRRTFTEQLRWETDPEVQALDDHSLAPRYNEIGFCTALDDEVFVDCGAFDGDTIKAFLSQRAGRFRRVIGLEPDPGSHAQLCRYAAALPDEVRERTEILPIAAGARKETLRFQCAGVGSHATADGNIEVQAAPLDELLGDARVTYIKMDIEGAELDAISGARRIIARDRPVVAACVYHLQDHLWRIPLLLHSIFDGYRLFLRRYGDEFGDVVCYAVPPHRLNPAVSG